VIAETGIFGLLLTLVVIGSIFRTGYQLHKRARDPVLKAIGTGLMPAIIALFIANMFGDRWQYLQITGALWGLLGCATRGLMIADEEDKAKAAVEEVPQTEELTPALAVHYGV
jgi:putative inorganic carbon (HCO3(-)) transporter